MLCGTPFPTENRKGSKIPRKARYPHTEQKKALGTGNIPGICRISGALTNPLVLFVLTYLYSSFKFGIIGSLVLTDIICSLYLVLFVYLVLTDILSQSGIVLKKGLVLFSDWYCSEPGII